ncbi:5'-methylthioadenosine/S-adenosylhomocysteine nucleosidase [Actinobacillus delphinicola]|uniref:5'-methylthioadenosine/S-adenosylhomocysteine nucleosidase n=1 Tax=Actinobacillus delphinicola TaxID=51161 RepID=A0A448TSW5_9PAST|nr:5'-methylthioadenosine/adenosylhomocysteine nucleosidase [Actinobacillus delphinicola]MDG6897305.1 5'-methylthioadenosine/S-adenosylhomocysteine nucleosidase [Actinobacillus delphinicola]VEJ09127.1 5'-methylthioadenosine/S-adenosylhomocysteine nucleosidase [Actinobacillus delphinicola]
MKIGIIGAMPQEVEILAGLLEDKTVTKIANCTLYQGKIGNKEIALMQSGIGKVAAAMGTTLLLNIAKPDLVLNTGSAGGVGEGLAVGDVVISTETVHHDADVTAFGYAKGQLPACPARFTSDENLVKQIATVAKAQGQHIKFGLIASGDSFIQGGDALMQIKRDFPEVLAVEMEAAAIAQVCGAFAVPFVVVRAISDAGNGEANISFEEFLPIAAKQSSKMVLALLETL